MPPEDTRNDVTRRSCDWCALRDMLLAGHGENDGVSLGCHYIRANLIQIENDSRDVWSGAMLRSSNLPHSVGVHRDILRVAVADRVREIQQDTVWIHRRINVGLNRGTDCDFDP